MRGGSRKNEAQFCCSRFSWSLTAFGDSCEVALFLCLSHSHTHTNTQRSVQGILCVLEWELRASGGGGAGGAPFSSPTGARAEPAWVWVNSVFGSWVDILPLGYLIPPTSPPHCSPLKADPSPQLSSLCCILIPFKGPLPNTQKPIWWHWLLRKELLLLSRPAETGCTIQISLSNSEFGAGF